uniref:NADH-ubiquinone oxidoreductase chain 2 n=1 Tax=Leptomantella albella TaxID=627747 RepID=X5CWV4_LEPAB|nr:NADH dehydrogenase subunit 2 [Leptomantella albella]AHW52361.1 NADH dehydrogenase subunit 2 [Leptomantella albella]
MPNNSTKILFLMTLISGMLISVCANSWLGAWMGLEINLLSFLPMLAFNKNLMTTEAALKYFLIQAVASSTFLFMILLKTNFYEMFFFLKNFSWNSIMMIPLLLKIASAPFHWWLPSVLEGLSWFNCFLILSIQKVAPLILISYLISNNNFIQFMIVTSALIGAIGGLNQTSIRKILAFSSINHVGWMLTTMIMNSNLWSIYLAIYIINITAIITVTSALTMNYISQIFNALNYTKLVKYFLLLSLLSLGGLPPFIGFFPKWMTIQYMAMNWMVITALILIMTSLLTLFYYLRIIYTSLMLLSTEVSWSTQTMPNYHYSTISTSSLVIALLGISSCTLLVALN